MNKNNHYFTNNDNTSTTAMEPTREPAYRVSAKDGQISKTYIELKNSEMTVFTKTVKATSVHEHGQNSKNSDIGKQSAYIDRIVNFIEFTNDTLDKDYELVGTVQLVLRKKQIPDVCIPRFSLGNLAIGHDERVSTTLSSNCRLEPTSRLFGGECATYLDTGTMRNAPKYKQNTCIICYDKVRDSDFEKSETPDKCSGVYHYKCLSKWVKNNQSCPTCRAHISPEQELRVTMKSKAYTSLGCFEKSLGKDMCIPEDFDFDRELRIYEENSRSFRKRSICTCERIVKETKRTRR